MVLEFMTPRPMTNWKRPLNIKIDPKLKALPDEMIKTLDENLADKSYVFGDFFSDADVLLFSHLHITEKGGKSENEITTTTRTMKDLGPNVLRWKLHVRNLLSSNETNDVETCQPKKLPKDDMKSVKKLYSKYIPFSDEFTPS